MLILGLLGMYFDAVVVEVKTFLLLFRLSLAILCSAFISNFKKKSGSLDDFFLTEGENNFGNKIPLYC